MAVKNTTGKLSPREEAFVLQYLMDNDAVGAALRAGYAKTTADAKSWAWVGHSREKCPANKLHVWDAVRAAKAARSEATQIDAAYVLRRHAEIDAMDVLDIMGEDWVVKPLSEWPRVWRITLSAFEVAELFEGSGAERKVCGVLKKFKWADKLKNLETLGRHVDVGAYRDTVKVEVDDLATLLGKRRAAALQS